MTATINEALRVEFDSPSIEDFIKLRISVGWGDIDETLVQQSLRNSLFHVVIRKGSQLIAMGRVVGDGAMYFYIQDVVVAINYQQHGLGSVIMDSIENYLANTAQKGATIGLLAAKGKEKFYERYGYITRPNFSLGNGMCRFIT